MLNTQQAHILTQRRKDYVMFGHINFEGATYVRTTQHARDAQRNLGMVLMRDRTGRAIWFYPDTGEAKAD